MADAVIIGAGPNGLVAANLLADQGWEVIVLEEAAAAGWSRALRRAGRARLHPRHVQRVLSVHARLAAHAQARARALGRSSGPGAGSPWPTRRVTGPVRRSPATSMRRSPRWTNARPETATRGGSSTRCGAGSARARWAPSSLPFPPVRPVLGLIESLGPRELLRFARFSTLPVRRAGRGAFPR